MPAPLKDDLSFSDNPKMVGERNPDSVLFKINELVEKDDKPIARGKNEIFDDAEATEEAPLPPVRAVATPEQKVATNSGLIKVQDLLEAETEAANAIPSAPVNPGLIPTRPEPPPSPPEAIEAIAAPPSKVPIVMMVAGGVAVLIAVGAVMAAMG